MRFTLAYCGRFIFACFAVSDIIANGHPRYANIIAALELITETSYKNHNAIQEEIEMIYCAVAIITQVYGNYVNKQNKNKKKLLAAPLHIM